MAIECLSYLDLTSMWYYTQILFISSYRLLFVIGGTS